MRFAGGGFSDVKISEASRECSCSATWGGRSVKIITRVFSFSFIV
ncbi:hypothetical protein AALP_AA2G056300 [Arabis alpina]|uniref:Uncharacterized protein n=1 Tax=Arabis alpina TaxID=50452 RepID=A0A087HFI9_ARAAL|nr:hypothetical protein AALP_AA2G056300 [Arabis alpina]